MKTIGFLFLIVAILVSYSGCEMLEKGSEDSSCGESASLSDKMYPGADDIVERAFYGFVDDNITFVFHTPDWLGNEPICPYKTISADYSVSLNPEDVGTMQGVTMLGVVLVGQKTYQIPLVASGYTFSGKDASISVDTDEFDKTGVAYIQGEVVIRFPYSGNTAADIQKLHHALNRMDFIINIHRVKI